MNNLRSEIGRAVDQVLLWRRRGETYLEKQALKTLQKLINTPTIDLRPLPPEQPHPFPPPERCTCFDETYHCKFTCPFHGSGVQFI